MAIAAEQMANPSKPSTLPLLLLLVVGQAIIAADYGLSSIALPSIEAGMHLDAVTGQWIITGFSLAFGGFLILGGRMADVYGQKFCFMLALALTVAGATGAMLSPNIGWLIAARIAAGVSAALMFPAAISLMTLTFPEGPERFRAFTGGMIGQNMAAPIAAMTAAWLIGQIALLFGHDNGWRGAFLFNIPLALLALVASAKLLPVTRRVEAHKEPIDLLSAVLGTAGFAGLIWGLSHVVGEGLHASETTIGAFAAGLVLLVLFGLRQRNPRTALISVPVLKSPNLIAGALVTGFLGGTVAPLLTIVVKSLQGSGFSAQTASYVIVPYSVLAVVFGLSAPIWNRFLLAFPKISLVAALLIVAAAYGLGSIAHTPHALLINVLIAMGLAAPAATLGIALAIREGVSHVAHKDQGVATAFLYTVMQVVLAFCVATMLSVVGKGGDAFVNSFRTGAILAVIGAVIAAVGLQGGRLDPNASAGH